MLCLEKLGKRRNFPVQLKSKSTCSVEFIGIFFNLLQQDCTNPMLSDQIISNLI